MSDRTGPRAEAVGGGLVLAGAALVAAVSPLNLVRDTNLWDVAEPAPSWVLVGVAVAVAVQWVRGGSGVRRGVTVLALVGSLGGWFVAELLSSDPGLYPRLSVGWAIAFAVAALFLGVGLVGIRSSADRRDAASHRVATGLVVVGALLVVGLSMDRIYVGPPDWVQFRYTDPTGLVFGTVAVGVAAEWLLAPRGLVPSDQRRRRRRRSDGVLRYSRGADAGGECDDGGGMGRYHRERRCSVGRDSHGAVAVARRGARWATGRLNTLTDGRR
ncbi:MAG: hypothetical protein ABEJ68_11640 [Halobacteriaceae archaeon]